MVVSQQTFYWFMSTVAQVFAALVVVSFVVFAFMSKREEIIREDTIKRLSNFDTYLKNYDYLEGRIKSFTMIIDSVRVGDNIMTDTINSELLKLRILRDRYVFGLRILIDNIGNDSIRTLEDDMLLQLTTDLEAEADRLKSITINIDNLELFGSVFYHFYTKYQGEEGASMMTGTYKYYVDNMSSKYNLEIISDEMMRVAINAAILVNIDNIRNKYYSYLKLIEMAAKSIPLCLISSALTIALSLAGLFLINSINYSLYSWIVAALAFVSLISFAPLYIATYKMIAGKPRTDDIQ